MTFAEYARHKQVSRAAVTKAINTGRIQAALYTETDGKKYLRSELADELWNANTAHEKRRHNDALDAAIEIQQQDEAKRSVHGMPLGRPPADLPATPQIGFDSGALGLAPDPQEAVAKDGSDATYSKARALKEHYLAETAKLAYQERRGELADVREIAKKWTALGNAIRTKVLGISSKAKQRIPDLTPGQVAIIEKLCRESLEDLSDGRD